MGMPVRGVCGRGGGRGKVDRTAGTKELLAVGSVELEITVFVDSGIEEAENVRVQLFHAR